MVPVAELIHEHLCCKTAIFRGNKTRYGYELLFRDGLSNAFPDIDGTEATTRVLSNSFLAMGMDRWWEAAWPLSISQRNSW